MPDTGAPGRRDGPAEHAGQAGQAAQARGASAHLPTACRVCALALLVGLAAAPPLLGTLNAYGLTQLFFRTQDLVWLAVAAAVLFGLTLLPSSGRLPSGAGPVRAWAEGLARHPGAIALGLTLAVVAIAAIGTYAVFGGFPLTRDEILADFDAAALGAGQLAARLPTEWLAFRDALNPEFMAALPAPLWASGYLPGNAALRALAGLVLDRGLASPLLAGAAMLALWRAGRRLWPDRPDAVVVSLVLLAASSQVLLTAMTGYAMTAHLALDLVWLALFLRDDARGHAGAIATGALATGLHQIVFHPLFAAPFIVDLWLRRRRSLALVYVAAYAAIGLFWASYWGLVVAASGIAPDPAAGAGGLFGLFGLLGKAAELVARFSLDGAALMLANLLRFAAWQHLLLLPLAGAAYAAIRRGEGPARPLVAGVALTLAAVFVLLPYQGHGWGYRYLHGVLGNLTVLAGYGWIAVTRRTRERAPAWAAFGIATAFSLLVMLPVHVAQAAAFAAPYRAAWSAIARTDADVVIVDPTGVAFAADLVRNDPFLRHRPRVLDLDFVGERELAALCAAHRVAVFGTAQARASGILLQSGPQPPFDAARARRRALMATLGCDTPVK